MKQLIRPAVLAALTITALFALAVAQTASVTAELTQIEHRLAKAGVDKDFDYFNNILASDWTTVDLTGNVLTKEQLLHELSSQNRIIESAKIDDIKVRVYGEVAIVTGRTTATGSYKGQRASLVLRFTDIFIKRDGRWQVVASQGTQVAQ